MCPANKGFMEPLSELNFFGEYFMATVYRRTYTMIMPKNVEIIERNGKTIAKWIDAKGRKHTEQTTVGRKGQLKVIRYAPTFWAQ